MSNRSEIRGRYPHPNEPTWSRTEKAITRAVFDAALKRELHEIMQTKERAAQIKEPADLWELGRYLTQRRKEIDDKHDFRASRQDASPWETLV